MAETTWLPGSPGHYGLILPASYNQDLSEAIGDMPSFYKLELTGQDGPADRHVRNAAASWSSLLLSRLLQTWLRALSPTESLGLALGLVP